ncbi:hypothetical protein BH10BAC5_BH10BAC5_18240 [soil metagenome]
MDSPESIYELPGDLETEYTEILHQSKHAIIEQIISKGHVTEEGKWLIQEHAEWIMIIQGEAKIEIEGKKFTLHQGDHILIQGSKRHRVTETSSIPECIWLAVHFK